MAYPRAEDEILGLRKLFPRVLFPLLFLALLLIGLLGSLWLYRKPAETPSEHEAYIAPQPPSPSRSPRVGLVAGHLGHDSGAVCADGLTEVEVNTAIAREVARRLEALGYTVDVLEEFDERLHGYRAAALLSIHADSCEYINELATGFKVARAQADAVPERSDRLVACLISAYGRSTGLRFHKDSITYDMTDYHAFREIAAETPAAIIEIGFLYLDRDLLTRGRERVVEGIVEGLRCFLEEGR
ncbi:N-acetylmuramoyl-L-alanine amidase [Thermoflexus sp.]|uniref:N-acetylmuramoyl-L-alanine amidase family protein n=1 Tax=Thermoflexus sp. TaxID=1969742 RepID=UPI0025ED2F2D|nr:N-acetylmuramoyl-L-alanine amidase [Thermoflexus sp.]MDW8181478.1 N-acetylmuramoyl-L-alanine amidase [Anaerolineae bacterium]MCS6964455.1 N-acetylmuramoyl-L-alanine amidase [Thermoflexus sp.]MCS7352019.1 N-acetylmuramoyl-L-alanine amidase [Thermoflexus sp.]MCX7689277.1 N-acetylmuramoyl-L-alanine amidase [Thermoflexus sp.]MDW8185072.1 N-acetylmuramoyl-L-alanine amidase [Anaerolineae bacterium]